jgi:hypothetical protein
MVHSETIQKPEVKVIAGTATPKKLKLTQSVHSLGSSEDSDIRVTGNKVSAQHATIEFEQASGDWLIRNKSSHGVLVNSKPVDVAKIKPGDHIQIGESLLLEFSGKVVSKKTDKAKGSTAGAKPSSRKMLLYIAGGVYALAMVAVIMFFSASGSESDSNNITSDYLVKVLDSTRTHLAEFSIADSDKESAVRNMRSTGLYYKILYAENAADKQKYIDELVAELDGRVFQAWLFEAQGDYPRALKEYREIEQIVPDVRAPITKVAIWRLSEIQSR